MDSFAGFEAFAQVVECGSFTAAATKLQTAKSSVSDAVRGLEERLGVRLLERTTRRVRPTEAGLLLYERCRRMLDEAGAAGTEARAFQLVPSGRLRVAVPESFGERYLVPGLTSLFRRFPGVTIELVSDARPVRLVDDRFDLAIRIVDAPDENLVVRRIGTSRIVIVASPDYLAERGPPTTALDVLDHECVTPAPPLPWNERWCIGDEIIRVSARVSLSTAGALRSAALVGIGLVPVPDWIVADAIAEGRLVRVLGSCTTSTSGIYAVYPSNRLVAPLTRLFVDHVVRELRARGVPE